MPLYSRWRDKALADYWHHAVVRFWHWIGGIGIVGWLIAAGWWSWFGVCSRLGGLSFVCLKLRGCCWILSKPSLVRMRWYCQMGHDYCWWTLLVVCLEVFAAFESPQKTQLYWLRHFAASEMEQELSLYSNSSCFTSLVQFQLTSLPFSVPTLGCSPSVQHSVVCHWTSCFVSLGC